MLHSSWNLIPTIFILSPFSFETARCYKAKRNALNNFLFVLPVAVIESIVLKLLLGNYICLVWEACDLLWRPVVVASFGGRHGIPILNWSWSQKVKIGHLVINIFMLNYEICGVTVLHELCGTQLVSARCWRCVRGGAMTPTGLILSGSVFGFLMQLKMGPNCDLQFSFRFSLNNVGTGL
jgi:hypothetical protein